MLAFNARPNDGVLSSMRKLEDPRVAKIKSAHRTAHLSMGIDERLKPILGPVKETRKARLRQEVDIHKFAEWAIAKIDSEHMSPEFRALATAAPTVTTARDCGPDPWQRSMENIKKKHGLKSAGAVRKRLNSIAGLLVAVAVSKYKLRVTEADQKSDGTYATLATIARDACIGPVDDQTIADALDLAIDLADRDAVMSAIKARSSREKR